MSLSPFDLLDWQLTKNEAKLVFCASVEVKMANCVKIKMNEKLMRLKSSTFTVENNFFHDAMLIEPSLQLSWNSTALKFVRWASGRGGGGGKICS